MAPGRILPSTQAHRIEIVRLRVWADETGLAGGGNYPTKVPEATASQIAERICQWLVANT
jgi:hypothetical protein